MFPYLLNDLLLKTIISEEVDLLQGRVFKSVFVRHYLKENPIKLGDRTLKALRELGKSLGPIFFFQMICKTLQREGLHNILACQAYEK